MAAYCAEMLRREGKYHALCENPRTGHAEAVPRNAEIANLRAKGFAVSFRSPIRLDSRNRLAEPRPPIPAPGKVGAAHDEHEPVVPSRAPLARESYFRSTSFVQPAPKRRLTLTRLASRQQAYHTNILIQVRPVNAHATANKTPIDPLRRCPMRQTREPRQRHSNVRPSARSTLSASSLTVTPRATILTAPLPHSQPARRIPARSDGES
jgi:hypothetical protein